MVRERILLVDDEESVRNLCKIILEQEGYEVEPVPNGYEAIKKAREKPFELLLTDIRMPGLDGIETTQAIREIQPEILCVVITGYGQMDLALRAIKVGVQGFLLKPFTPEELVNTVSKVLEIERLRRDNLRLKALLPLFELSKTFMSTLELPRLEEEILQITTESLATDSSWLYLVDSDTLLHLPKETSIILTTELQTKVMIEIEEAREAILWQLAEIADTELAELMRKAGIGQMLVAPLRVGERLLGFLAALKSTQASPFLASDPDFITILAGQAAVALENARLFEEIQRAFRELQELDKMKSNFITIVSHELRTPLSLVIGYASLLLEEAKDPESKEYAQVIMRNSMRLSSLINDMLDLKRLAQKAMTVQVRDVILPELIERVLEGYRPIARDKNQKIEVEIPSGLFKVRADPAKLEVVLSNLVSNAVKFTPPGGEIKIGVENGDRPLMYVKDNGIGIPPEEQEKIFWSFYQVEDPLTRKHGGLGLGLSIAKELVELWGGRIWVESEVGKGSTFWFSLPSQNEPKEAPKPQDKA
ncbi:MAG: hypothetical protein DRI61_02355 [Chloroflexi bacterium]|nr:MAG: hypothetical protein DRI61_02355 [Chloroflexota bacterium]HDN80190.1 response regulator [Chloroflexota bacterium]